MSLIRALVFVALLPSACCVGVYGCTAWNVAAVHQAVAPGPTAESIALQAKLEGMRQQWRIDHQR